MSNLWVKYRELYWIWSKMRCRCENVNNPSYKYYGALGIAVCERWQSFENFLEDMNNRPSRKYSIERRDNKKGYEPENCYWATYCEQNRNRKSTRITYDIALDIAKKILMGVSQISLARKYGISKSLPSEIHRGKKWKDAYQEAQNWWRAMADDAKDEAKHAS